MRPVFYPYQCPFCLEWFPNLPGGEEHSRHCESLRWQTVRREVESNRAPERSELCAAVFGVHDWWWPQDPTLTTFDEATLAHVSSDYLRVCRRCNRYQVFVVMEVRDD